MMKPMATKLTFAVFAFLQICCSDCLAQTEFSLHNSIYSIETSDEQDEAIDEINDTLGEKIEQLENTLRSTKMKLQELRFKRDVAIAEVLEPKQLNGIFAERDDQSPKKLKETEKFFGEYSKFIQSIPAASNIQIFEGLPRATEAELAKIKLKNRTFQVGEWSFYQEPLNAKPFVKDSLCSTLKDYRLFMPYSGGKFCGGFHPDFCAKWTTEGKATYLQICLGCHEAVLVTPNGKTIFDFNSEAWKSFALVAISSFKQHREVIEKLDQMLGQ